MNFKIEFFGDAGRVHNVRFAGDLHASNEVLLGIFYEDAAGILEDINRLERGNLPADIRNDYDFGDFISGVFHREYIIIYPDDDRKTSKSYKVGTNDLKEILVKWLAFKSNNQNGVVKTVSIHGEYVNAP